MITILYTMFTLKVIVEGKFDEIYKSDWLNYGEIFNDKV